MKSGQNIAMQMSQSESDTTQYLLQQTFQALLDSLTPEQRAKVVGAFSGTARSSQQSSMNVDSAFPHRH